MKYFRLFDRQCGRHMATGYNTTSEKELVDDYIEYVSIDSDEDYSKQSIESMLGIIEANEFDIEVSETPFPELDYHF